jgi:hypothetical protein
MKKIYELEASDKIFRVVFYQFCVLHEQGKLDWADIDESGINEKYPGFLEDFSFERVDFDALLEFISIERRFEKEQFSSLFYRKTHLFCFFDGNIDELLSTKDFKDFPLIFHGYNLSPFNDLVSVEYLYSDFIFNLQGDDMNLSASPNLYDNGYCSIEFLDEEKFVVEYYDENNGSAIDIYNYSNGCFSKLKEIDSIKLLEALYEKYIRWAMWNLSDSLLENRNAVLLSLKVDKFNIYHYIESLAGKLLTDREIVYELVAIDGNTLQFASEEIKNDKEIALTAIKNNYRSLQYCSESLLSNKEFMLEVLSVNNKIKDLIERGKMKQDVILDSSNNDTQSTSIEDEDLPF